MEAEGGAVNRFRTLTGVIAVTCVVTAASPQDNVRKLEKWQIDPYTKNDPKKMKKAGYVSYGPFEWGDKHNTDDILRALGNVRIRFVETAHIKLGVALPTYLVPTDPKIKKKLRDELTRLKKKIPKVNPRTRRLDPWLRLHLFAQRCEDLYAEFSRRLGVTDDSFPSKRGTFVNGRYMGEGKYLGEPSKYTVLLLRREGDHTRYLTTFVGSVQKFAKRHNFKTIGSLLFVTAEDLYNGRNRDDTAMHCHVVWNLTHNFIDGYRFYSHDLPVWFKEGMAHWFDRRVYPKFNDFDQTEGTAADMRRVWRWRPKVRQMIGTDKFTPAAEVLKWRDYGQIKFNDHMAIWSRIDYLMSLGDKKWATFMNSVKGIVDKKTGLVTGKNILDLQRKAMRKAWGLNPLTLDERWTEYVIKNYPTR